MKKAFVPFHASPSIYEHWTEIVTLLVVLFGRFLSRTRIYYRKLLFRKMKRSQNRVEEDERKKVEMLRLSRHSFEKVQECEVINDIASFVLGRLSPGYKKNVKNLLFWLRHKRKSKLRHNIDCVVPKCVLQYLKCWYKDDSKWVLCRHRAMKSTMKNGWFSTCLEKYRRRKGNQWRNMWNIIRTPHTCSTDVTPSKKS